LTRAVALLLFLSVACSIIAGLHYYFWVRLVRDTHLSGPVRQIATASVIALACLTIATPIAGRLSRPVARLLAWPGFLWLGMTFVLALALLGTDVLRLLAGLIGRVSGHAIFDPSRRAFTARLLGGAALTTMAGVTAAAVHATRRPVAVKRVEILLDRLPASADGMRIVQLCDMHVGGLLGRPFVEQVVATSNQLNPDVIAIVGDLVDGTIAQLRPTIAPMADLRARHGVFFVTGNHEYYSSSGAQAWMDEIDRMGIRVLRNQRVPVGVGPAGFDLAGVPDRTAASFAHDGPRQDVGAAMAGRDPSRAVVLLAHQPLAVHQAVRHGVDLQLSGHTHGGQIWPWGALVRLQQPFIRGLHRVRDTQVYVSCGTGFWGPPMRLGAPAEITEIVLRSKMKVSGHASARSDASWAAGSAQDTTPVA
jgi:predicted MPP superfamily phosphohydrolase